jgi:hypothetical protein
MITVAGPERCDKRKSVQTANKMTTTSSPATMMILSILAG